MNHEHGINAINVPFDRAKRIINDLNEFGNYGEKGSRLEMSYDGNLFEFILGKRKGVEIPDFDKKA